VSHLKTNDLTAGSYLHLTLAVDERIVIRISPNEGFVASAAVASGFVDFSHQ